MKKFPLYKKTCNAFYLGTQPVLFIVGSNKRIGLNLILFNLPHLF